MNSSRSAESFLIGSSSAPDRGYGISTYAKEIASELAARGSRVFFAAPPPDDFSWLEQNGIELIPTPHSANGKETVSNLVVTVRERRIQGIINNDNAMVQNIAPVVPCPFISVGHLESTTIAELLGHNLQWTDYVVAISSDMQRGLTRRLRIDPTRVPLIHNGIKDLALVREPSKKPDQDLRVIFGGGFHKRKGGQDIINLLRRLRGRKGVRFEIFGFTPERVVKEFANCSNVRIHGKVDRVEFFAAVAASDVLLMPSRSEGCPMALLEAISCGLVPIVSDGTGAMRWIVTNGEDGFVCRCNSWTDEAYECLMYMANSKDEVNRMSSAARRTFEQRFKVEYTASKLMDLISKPRIDRSSVPASIQLVRWHRKPNKEASLIERVRFKLGILTKDQKVASREFISVDLMEEGTTY